jgi:hypothetical protein
MKRRMTRNQAVAKLRAVQQAFAGESGSVSFMQAHRARIEAGRLRQFGVQQGNAEIVVAAERLAAAAGEIAGAETGWQVNEETVALGRQALQELPGIMQVSA